MKKVISAYLIMLRHKNDMTQDDIALRVGIPRVTYAQYEVGSVLVPLNKLDMLVSAYGGTMRELGELIDQDRKEKFDRLKKANDYIRNEAFESGLGFDKVREKINSIDKAHT